MKPAGWRRGLRQWILTAALVPAVAPLAGAQAPAMLYRVFLRDGASVISYGEYARVADRVVFSLPLGETNGEPRLQLVSLPATLVDWEQTEKYAESVRFTTYLETRAEAEFAALTVQLARALNDLSLMSDPARRLQAAQQARRALVEFPRVNFGYRANDIGRMVSLLDEVIGELQAVSGDRGFDLSFVAVTEPPPVAPLLASPTTEETIRHALVVAKLTDSVAERLMLLETVLQLLNEAVSALPSETLEPLRREAETMLARERRLDRSYNELASRALARASRHAADGDVRGVDRAIRDLMERDEELGRARPEVMAPLVSTLEAKLEAARRLSLAREEWLRRRDAYRTYERAIRDPLEALLDVKPWLDQIKALSGPDPRRLAELHRRVDAAAAALDRIEAPGELAAVHRILASALRFAQQAANLRSTAVLGADDRVARDASSAAAAAVSMSARARDEVGRLLTAPQPQ